MNSSGSLEQRVRQKSPRQTSRQTRATGSAMLPWSVATLRALPTTPALATGASEVDKAIIEAVRMKRRIA